MSAHGRGGEWLKYLPEGRPDSPNRYIGRYKKVMAVAIDAAAYTTFECLGCLS